jgi:hypothetical protein
MNPAHVLEGISVKTVRTPTYLYVQSISAYLPFRTPSHTFHCWRGQYSPHLS